MGWISKILGFNLTIGLTVLTHVATASPANKPLTLDQAVKTALSNHPSIQAEQARLDQLSHLETASFAPDSPWVGISELDRGNRTTYFTLSQRIHFPIKYYLRSKSQSHKSEAQKAELTEQKLRLRGKVIATYYSLFALGKIQLLTQEDLRKLRELSRVAESKYASGKVPQLDSMRAHVAQTQVELDLIVLREEEKTLLARFKSLLGKNAFESSQPLQSIANELPVPDVRNQIQGFQLTQVKSPTVEHHRKKLHTVRSKKQLAYWELAPDFNLRYQTRIAGAPTDSHILSVEMRIPLWFWGKSAQIASARSEEQQAQFRLQAAQQELQANLASLKAKILSEYELLRIFDTSLVPQAITSYNNATSSYRANKIRFLDFLDAERSLLKVRIARYRTLVRYIEALTEFEAQAGVLISGIGESP